MNRPLPCSCPAAGFCERHGIDKTPWLHHLCVERDDYRGAWDAGEGPLQPATILKAQQDQQAQPTQVQIPPVGDCDHRGKLLRVGACDLCGLKGQDFDIFACHIHGECSVNRRHSKIRSCVACSDNTSLKVPPPDAIPVTLSVAISSH